MIHRSDSQMNLDLIVFAQRNRAYGAFDLRKSYNGRVKFSFFVIAAGSFALAMISFCYPEKTTIKDEMTIISCPMDTMTLVEFIQPPKNPFQAKAQQASGTKAAFKKPTLNHSFEISKDPEVVTETTVSTVENREGSDYHGLADTLATGPESGEIPGGVAGETSDIDDRTSGFFADVMPVFPNGEKALAVYVLKNLKFPFVDEQVSGKVFVQFTVAADGHVSNVQLIKGIHQEFDDEAMRVIAKMPSWTPGKYHGRSVAVKKVIPIHFRVD